MDSLRIGNDYKISWAINKKDGTPFYLEDKTVRLFLSTPRGRTEFKIFTVDNNVVSWTFFGKDQIALGNYTATLLISYGNDRRITVDKCDVFRLVPKTCVAGEGGCEGIVEGTELTFSSNLNIVQIQPIVPTSDDEGNIYAEGILITDAIPKAIENITDKETEIGKAETLRVQAENERKSSETARQQAETARQQAETARAEAETARIEAEKKRVSAETERVTAENDRQQAETARQQAETARNDAEALRASAEQTRKSSEQERVTAETKRNTNEQERVTAETQRSLAESQRKNDEQTRKSNEETRKLDEALRTLAENERSSAESRRQQNETLRSEAETQRQEAERQRAKAETAREQAETAREQAEAQRETATSDAISKANAATGNANAAAQYANTSAGNADAAAEKANAAAEGIDNKIAQKQDATDDALETTDKTVPGAINEVLSIAKDAQPKETGKGLSTNDYTNEDKQKVGNALLKTEQTLTPEEQEQARANIAAAPNYYDKNGFVISPLGMSAHNLRYIGFKETDGSTICYLLTKSRCLKMDFSTYEVFWDVDIEGSNDIWQHSCISLRVIDDVVYVIRAYYTTQSIVLVQLNDTDGSTIQSAEIPIKTYYSYNSFKNNGSPLITAEKIYAVDNVDKKIMSFDLSTLQTEVLKDNLSLTSSKSQLLWITNESKEYELVLCVFCENIIHVIREDGSIVDINIEQGYAKGDWEIYELNLSTKYITYLLTYKVFIGTMTDNGDGTYSANFSARKSGLLMRWAEQYSNSPKRMTPIQSLSILDPYNFIVEHLMTPTYNGAIFVSFSGESLIADAISKSESSMCNITKLYV